MSRSQDMEETSRPSVFSLEFGQGLHERGVFNAKRLHLRPSMTYLRYIYYWTGRNSIRLKTQINLNFAQQLPSR